MNRFAGLLCAGAMASLAACQDRIQPGDCFQPNAVAYSFYLLGDSNLVFHWPASYMPVRVYAENSGQLPANVAAAMTLWTGAFRCGELALTAAADSTHADIIVRNPAVLPAPPAVASVVLAADSVGACQGVTQVDTAGTSIAGPIRSFVAPLSSDTAAVAACYHFVTAHELGHALGLFGHSTDTNDLMYPTPRRRALSADDMYTIQLLYHVVSKLGPPAR